MVGTTKKSAATKFLAWFLRKVRQVWEGGFGSVRPAETKLVATTRTL